MSSQIIKKYLQKRNPNCPALWQKPRNYSTGKFSESDAVWYCNVPLGKHTLDNLLGRMSKKAGLSSHFTSHCIRATSVTILKAAGLENSRVRSVTGHKSDASIDSYHERPTIQQQVESSAILWLQWQRVKLLLSKPPLSHEVLLLCCCKTRARTKFAASINSLMSALNKPMRPRTFHRVLFKTVLSIFMDTLPKKTFEK